MPSLKDLKTRINSVKSTQKITKAMKMVAASKLKRAQTAAEATRPYAERMEKVLGSLGRAASQLPGAPLFSRSSEGAGVPRTDRHSARKMSSFPSPLKSAVGPPA